MLILEYDSTDVVPGGGGNAAANVDVRTEHVAIRLEHERGRATGVVSFDTPVESGPNDDNTGASDDGCAVVSPSRTSARQYGHSLT